MQIAFAPSNVFNLSHSFSPFQVFGLRHNVNLVLFPSVITLNATVRALWRLWCSHYLHFIHCTAALFGPRPYMILVLSLVFAEYLPTS